MTTIPTKDERMETARFLISSYNCTESNDRQVLLEAAEVLLDNEQFQYEESESDSNFVLSTAESEAESSVSESDNESDETPTEDEEAVPDESDDVERDYKGRAAPGLRGKQVIHTIVNNFDKDDWFTAREVTELEPELGPDNWNYDSASSALWKLGDTGHTDVKVDPEYHGGKDRYLYKLKPEYFDGEYGGIDISSLDPMPESEEEETSVKEESESEEDSENESESTDKFQEDGIDGMSLSDHLKRLSDGRSVVEETETPDKFRISDGKTIRKQTRQHRVLTVLFKLMESDKDTNWFRTKDVSNMTPHAASDISATLAVLRNRNLVKSRAAPDNSSHNQWSLTKEGLEVTRKLGSYQLTP